MTNPVIEFARFRIDPASTADMLAARDALLNDLRASTPELLDVQLVRIDDATVMDVATWESRDAAEQAAQRIHQEPLCHRFFSFITDDFPVAYGEVIATPPPAASDSSAPEGNAAVRVAPLTMR